LAAIEEFFGTVSGPWKYRAEAMASADGGGPRALGRFSARFGTPAGTNVCSGVVATVLAPRR